MKRYILTGTPGSGKTSILRRLELDGFGVVEEAATDVIAQLQAQSLAESWTQPWFIDAIVKLQKQRQIESAMAKESVQFHDRSAICTTALANYLGYPISRVLSDELKRIRAERIFDKTVFFVRNLGFVAPTDARRINFEQALHFEEIHEEVYRSFGFALTYIELGSVSERVEAIKRVVTVGSQ